MSRFSLVNKTILVTGASSGIGAECCIAFSESGANLILLGRNQKKLDTIMKKLKPGNHTSLLFDLTNIDRIDQYLGENLKKTGKISGFVHSAGIDLTLPLSSLRNSDYQAIFQLNVISGFEIARVLSKKQFCEAAGASYIFISSVMGLVGEQAKIAYSASKGALIAGSRSMALELASKNIRVNCISPAIVQTELIDKLFEDLSESAIERIKTLHPLGFGSPDDIANAVVFLLSDESKWITGSNLVIDGGYSCR